MGTVVALPRLVHLRFDRGTILISHAPEHLDVTRAPGVMWDPRVQAHRAPASAYPALAAWLVEAGATFVDEARTDRRATDGWPELDLRAYQATALWAWELAQRRGVVVLPTGSGKTRIALAAMAHTRLPALCLVPTRVLLDQWRREVASVYPHPVGCYGDGRRDAAAVTVATYESGYRHMDRLGHRFALLVIDEVHHFGCGLRDEALEMSVVGARLGLTATPPRNPAHVEKLAGLVGPTVYELTIGDLNASPRVSVKARPNIAADEAPSLHGAVIDAFGESRTLRVSSRGRWRRTTQVLSPVVEMPCT